MQEYINIGKIDKNKIGIYKYKIVTDILILTYERLNNHILKYHNEEYNQVEDYLKEIIENPDIILKEYKQEDTLIYLKHIEQINKKVRVVIKLATNKKEKIYNKNSIITIMRQRDRSWEQTIRNKGEVIYSKILDKNE